MDREKVIKCIKNAIDCIDELPYSTNAQLAFYNLSEALKNINQI